LVEKYFFFNYLAATLEIVSEELDNFIDEFKNFFPKTGKMNVLKFVL